MALPREQSAESAKKAAKAAKAATFFMPIFVMLRCVWGSRFVNGGFASGKSLYPY